MSKKYKIIIFGATGFTGELCAKYMSERYSDVPMAIAGRSKEKLENIKSTNGLPFPIIVADAFDVDALDSMCRETEVVLSTVGPYHKYGSYLLEACIENGCHYVDITGESFWIKDMIDKHHKSAFDKGVRVINACGFDSAPSDLGVFYAVNQVDGDVKKVQCFQAWKGEASGGTIETMFSSMDAKLAKGGLGKFSLNPENTVSENQKKKTSDKIKVEKIPHLGGWTGPFVMALPNTRVVRRSAALSSSIGKYYGDDFVYSEGAYYSKKGAAKKVTFMTIALGLIIISPLRKLLRRFFRKPGEGPSQKAMDSGFFKSRFLVETGGGFRAFSMSSSGDPGYKMTSRMACESALCLAVENPADLPGGAGFGGLLTPSTGLGNTLIKRLKKIGVLFEEISLNN